MASDLNLIAFDAEYADPQLIRDYMNNDIEPDETGQFATDALDEHQRINDAFYAAFHNYDASHYNTFDYIFIGKYSSSWMDDGVRRVPRVVEAMSKFYADRDHVVLITPQIVAPMMIMFSLPHDSTWELPDPEGKPGRGMSTRKYPSVNDARKVKKFLLANMGRLSYAGSW